MSAVETYPACPTCGARRWQAAAGECVDCVRRARSARTRVRVCARVTEDTRDAARAAAHQEGLSMGAWVEALIHRELGSSSS